MKALPTDVCSRTLGLLHSRRGLTKLCTFVVLTGPKPKEIKVETFRIDYLIRTPKVEKLSLQPIRVKLTRRSIIRLLYTRNIKELYSTQLTQ